MSTKSGRVLLFNPRAVSNANFRIPNSILQIAASINETWDWVIVDGNREDNPWLKIKQYLDTDSFAYFGCTVMPGPQLKQAIPITNKIREHYPNITNIWGGYFASNQYEVCIKSDIVDFIINGPGDNAFPFLLNSLETDSSFEFIPNLIYQLENGDIVKTEKQTLVLQDELPRLPYDKLNDFYSIKNYLRPTHLGKETIAYHSSIGCPFSCSFCAVVPIFEARWKGKSAQKIIEDIELIRSTYGGDSIEFHDNNFFVSEKRTVEFSKLITPYNMTWWGEGRIDTIDKYSDESLQIMANSGCKMIFLGAESGSDDILDSIDKGGKQTGAQIKAFADRIGRFGIIPEYSFVLGFPGESESQVMKQIDSEIAFIKDIKSINPATEIIIYLYSPVPTQGSELYKKIVAAGFSFPSTLNDWLDPSWEKFDLRKNPLTPWLTPAMVDKVKNFETVLNAQYPTTTDAKITPLQTKVMKMVSSWRYKSGFFKFPYELKILQKFWLKYRQPEIEGFASE